MSYHQEPFYQPSSSDLNHPLPEAYSDITSSTIYHYQTFCDFEIVSPMVIIWEMEVDAGICGFFSTILLLLHHYLENYCAVSAVVAVFS